MLALALTLGLTAMSLSEATHEEILWRDGGLDEALAIAREKGTPILLEFSTQTCPWCKRLRKEAWVDKEVVEELEGWTCVRLDLTVDKSGVLVSQEAAELGNRFSVARFPTLVALRPDGTPEDVVAGFLNAPAMLAELRRIRRGEGTLGDLERQVAADGGDLEARYQLGLKRYSLGDYAGFQSEIDTIQQADPDGRSLPMRRMAIGQMREEMFGCMRGARPVEPAPLVAFLADEEHPSLVCEGWSVLGTIYRHMDDPTNMMAAWRKAWESAPDAERASCGNSLAWDYWEMREALSDDERAFALKVSQEATDELGDARGDDALRAAFLDTLACSYFMNDERESAIETAAECVRLVPGALEYRNRLASFQ
jgi:thioredoxin-related protein